MSKEQSFQQMVLEHWISTCRSINLDPKMKTQSGV